LSRVGIESALIPFPIGRETRTQLFDPNFPASSCFSKRTDRLMEDGTISNANLHLEARCGNGGGEKGLEGGGAASARKRREPGGRRMGVCWVGVGRKWWMRDVLAAAPSPVWSFSCSIAGAGRVAGVGKTEDSLHAGPPRIRRQRRGRGSCSRHTTKTFGFFLRPPPPYHPPPLIPFLPCLSLPLYVSVQIIWSLCSLAHLFHLSMYLCFGLPAFGQGQAILYAMLPCATRTR
jgi:hypothetical protein